MGRMYAHRLFEMGYGIVAVDVRQTGLDILADELAGHADRVLPICMDLSEPGAAAKIAALTRDLDVEVLINNAGMINVASTAAISSDRLAAMMGLHCVTPLLLCHEFVPRMQAAGGGYVLNVSSICAWMDWPLIGMYGNTKRFVKGFSRSLRLECAGSGVSVTTVLFGAVDTPLFGFPQKTVRWMKRLGVMISPEKAVSKALGAMFRRRKVLVPGLCNKLAIPLLPLVPDCLLRAAVRRFGRLFPNIRQAGLDDIPLIRRMADVAFRHTYRPLLTPEQIDYMMDWMYSEESLRRQMTEEQNTFLLLEGKGYASIRPDGSADGISRFHLEKLYVLPQYQGQGIGRDLINAAVAHAQRLAGGDVLVELNVNRHNPAVDFYKKMGFVIDRDVDNPIGGGHFMNDHIMAAVFPVSDNSSPRSRRA